MAKRESALVVVVLLVGAAIGAGATAMASAPPTNSPATDTTDDEDDGDSPFLPGGENATVEQFDSRDAFRSYVQQGQLLATDGRLGGRTFEVREDVDIALERDMMTETPQPMPTAVEDSVQSGGDGGAGAAPSGEPSQPDRVSGTNVQEQGLDEPAILKNDGSTIFYAPRDVREHRWRDHEQEDGHDTHVISADDPGAPEEVATIDSNGRMLLSGDTLVVIEDNQLLGYDVSAPSSPEQVWSQSLNSSVVTARLYDGQFYLVTRDRVSLDEPCPIEPLDGAASIRCTDVYHPREPTPVDATYSALSIDPDSGMVDAATSFVGTSDNTAVYMSSNALYVTYTQPADRGRLRIDFLLSTQSHRLPGWAQTRLEDIQSYNISSQAKQSEADRVLQQWYATLSEDRRHVVRENIRNDYRSYLSDRQRDLVQTGVVQVGVDDGDLSVDTVGTVPGRPLNQFSLDEHDGTLRVTTTIPAAGGQQSRNDLYVLDAESLERMGSAQDMGINERVYSVRYVGDTAYIVTFRRIDPFHVVDLSDPSDPEEVGELELPGFSSYLHPIDDDTVLGIGEQDGQVKAVLFDVSDPSNPTIEDDYILSSRWSAVSNTHHAFLLDRQHGVFFLPTGEGGNVISYTDGDLELETRVQTDGAALRAMYINDYMYVFGEDELAVVDETTWDRTDTLQLD
jgi:inhibitor of cysteine peptidase